MEPDCTMCGNSCLPSADVIDGCPQNPPVTSSTTGSSISNPVQGNPSLDQVVSGNLVIAADAVLGGGDLTVIGSTPGSIFSVNSSGIVAEAAGDVLVTAAHRSTSHGGSIAISAGDGTQGGQLSLSAGSSTLNTKSGGNLKLSAGDSSDASGGDVDIIAGSSASGKGGNIQLTSGVSRRGMYSGSIEMSSAGSTSPYSTSGFVRIRTGDVRGSSATVGSVFISP
jgi:hypothetical protein